MVRRVPAIGSTCNHTGKGHDTCYKLSAWAQAAMGYGLLAHGWYPSMYELMRSHAHMSPCPLGVVPCGCMQPGTGWTQVCCGLARQIFMASLN